MRNLTLLVVALALGCGGMEEVEGKLGEGAVASSWDPTATPEKRLQAPGSRLQQPGPKVLPRHPVPWLKPEARSLGPASPTPTRDPAAPDLPAPPLHPTGRDPDPSPDPDPDPSPDPDPDPVPDPDPDPVPDPDPCAPYEEALFACAEAYSCTLGGSLDLFCASFFCSYEWTDLELCRVVCASWQEAGGDEAGLDCAALLEGQGG